jgi:hypothetical protein
MYSLQRHLLWNRGGDSFIHTFIHGSPHTRAFLFAYSYMHIDLHVCMKEIRIISSNSLCRHNGAWGLPLSPVRLTKADLQPLVDKLAGQIPTWKAAMLERSGRLILIDATLAATPIYHMLCLDLPQWFFDYANKLERGFFWCASTQARSGQCMVAWNMVCSPKQLGGLGLKNLKLLNLALRMRWKWLELMGEDKPWSGLDFDISKEANDMFKAATQCILGDGNKLKFWTDRWMGTSSISELAPNLMKFVKPARKNDTVAQALTDNAWTQAFRGIPSVPAIVEFMGLWATMREAPALHEEPDCARWKLTESGQYSAKTAYQLFFLGRTEVPGMKELWSSGAPLKHKLHAWLALKDRLWTADRLEERGLPHPRHCPLCCQETETVEHLNMRCSFSREVWFRTLQPYNLHNQTPTADDELALWWPALSDAVPARHKKEINSLIVLVVRELWLERNARVFDWTATMPVELVRRIASEFDQWKRAKLCGRGSIREIG